MTSARRRTVGDLAVTLPIALVVLGPLLLGRGYWLFGDMVFVPEQPWKAGWLGLDGALPRAVPMDALMSLATHVVPGDVVQKALLLGGFLLGGLGVARLAGTVIHDARWCARAAATTLFCWNPWVHERLLIGQWAILLGYLLLPWVALAALRLRRSPRDWGPAAVALVASAVCSPSSGVMAAGVLALLGVRTLRQDAGRVLLLGALANLTWLVPALTAPGGQVSTDGVFAGFAARAESGAGVLASLLSLGGIWKTSILAGERTSTALVLLSCLLTVTAVAGVCRLPDRRRRLALGAIALAVALLPALPGGAAALEGLGSHLPGVALLRDSHRFLAPLGLVLAIGSAGMVTALVGRIGPGTRGVTAVVALVVAAPVLLLPSLAWGGLGDLQRSDYPAGWRAVADRIGSDDLTVVLPWAGSVRGFEWNDRRAVLDPAPRFLPGQVLVDDSTRLVDRIVPAEDPRVVAVGRALGADDPAAGLRALGVRWVLVEQGMGEVDVPAGTTAYDGDGLRLVDLSGDGPVADGSTDARPQVTVRRQIFVGTGHAVTILLLFAGAAWILRTRE